MNKKCKKIPSHFFAATGLTLLMSLGGASTAWEAFKQSGDALFAFEPQKYTGTVAEVTNNSCMSGGVYENIPDEVFNSIDDLNANYDSSWSNTFVNSLLGTPVTVEAATLPQFKDEIPDWASQDISSMADAGILKGYEDGTFRPSQTMTRLEYLTATVRSLKSDAEIDAIFQQAQVKDAEGGSTYTGVCERLNQAFKEAGGKYSSYTAESFWGTKYIVVAFKLGLDGHNGGLVVSSNVGGKLGFDYDITREEAASVMCTAVNDINNEGLTVTPGIDSIIPDLGSIMGDRGTAVRILVSNGLIAGVDSNYTFAPKKTLTRAEASVILSRITNKSRRVAKPTVPAGEYKVHNPMLERDITYHNPVTGKDETKDINDWQRDLKEPSYNGTKTGEISKDGYFEWNADLQMWSCLVAY